jgi:hypothetical protein
MDNVPVQKTAHEEQQYSWLTEKLSEWFPVFGSHVKRIGLFRTFIGGVPMYVSIPFFALFHLFCLFIFTTLILQPLLGLRKLQFKNYVIIDRHKITELPWFDRLNCMYCGYANGLATFFEARLSQIELWEGSLGFGKKIMLFLGLLIYFPFSLLNKIDHKITYELLISRPLGLHRLSTKDARLELECWDKGANKKTGFVHNIIRNERIFSMKINMALEQIESSWCPIKHADVRSEVIYPKHHENFLERHEIQKMKDILQSDGTVSIRKPHR